MVKCNGGPGLSYRKYGYLHTTIMNHINQPNMQRKYLFNKNQKQIYKQKEIRAIYLLGKKAYSQLKQAWTEEQRSARKKENEKQKHALKEQCLNERKSSQNKYCSARLFGCCLHAYEMRIILVFVMFYVFEIIY